MMTRLDWLVLAGCACAAWKPFLWVVYRLCPLDRDHLIEEERITLDNVLGIWARECWGHFYRVRQHVHPAWEVYRDWAHERARDASERYAAERTERLARYLEKVKAYELKAEPTNVTSIGVRVAGGSGH